MKYQATESVEDRFLKESPRSAVSKAHVGFYGGSSVVTRMNFRSHKRREISVDSQYQVRSLL